MQGKCDAIVDNFSYLNENTTRQGTWAEFVVPKAGLQKNDSNFYVRAKRLANNFKKILNVEPRLWSKESFSGIYWKLFVEHYRVKKLYTWQIIWTYKNCNELEKLLILTA